jgi:methylenetetrahydrofolate reductase (NADPH)
LLGAYALGIRNLLCLTGDHQTFGNHWAPRTHDLDSITLFQMCRDMRDEGVSVRRCDQGPEPRFPGAAQPVRGPR